MSYLHSCMLGNRVSWWNYTPIKGRHKQFQPRNCSSNSQDMAMDVTFTTIPLWFHRSKNCKILLVSCLTRITDQSIV